MSVASLSATVGIIAGSQRPLASLITDAPAAIARAATDASYVSTDTTTSEEATTASIDREDPVRLLVGTHRRATCRTARRRCPPSRHRRPPPCSDASTARSSAKVAPLS